VRLGVSLRVALSEIELLVLMLLLGELPEDGELEADSDTVEVSEMVPEADPVPV